jgi:integrase
VPNNAFLVKRRQTWYVRVRVPQALAPEVGTTHVVRSLKTRDAAEARARRWQVIGQLHAQFAQRVAANGASEPAPQHPIEPHLEPTRKRPSGTPARCSGAPNPEAQRASQVAVKPRKWIEIQTDRRDQGDRWGITTLAGRWLEEAAGRYTKQTLGQHRHAVSRLAEFTGTQRDVRDIDRWLAGQFVSEKLLKSGSSRKTVNRQLSSLSGFWRWLDRRGFVVENPWRGQHEVAGRGQEKRKRPYAEHELVKLLATDPRKHLGTRSGAALADLMRLGLLTGARLNELCELHADDVIENGAAIRITNGKTANAKRVIPLHQLVEPIIARRRRAANNGPLFPELKPGGPDQKRSWYISKRYTVLRREVLGDTGELDFHSFRRSFATFLERASTRSPVVTESLIAQLMGHAKQSLALRIYAGGFTFDDLKKGIAALGRELPAKLIKLF